MATRDTYTKVHEDWKDRPDKSTAVYATDLEHIEQGIKEAADKRALKEIYDDNSINLGRKEGTRAGFNSATIGLNVSATGAYACAKGTDCVSSGRGASSEGKNTKAGGDYCHSEGIDTVASEESYNRACHTEGIGTKSYGEAQHVGGKYNEQVIGAVVIGGGISDTDRKNIYILEWNGNAIFAGDIKNGVGVSLNSLKSAVDNLSDIAAGGTIAKVFDTKEDLDAWLAVEGNAETLVVGQNIYIKAKDTPDYWWDGTSLQVLETDKVEIESMTYDETMAILNATAEEVE